MDIQLLSRIEDQLIERFNETFRQEQKTGPITRDEMFDIFIKWMDFWISQKMVSKFPNPVVDMKNHVCDLRIGFILDKARKWDMDEAVKAWFETRYNFN